MTKEEKQLLLKDLCARLPYEVIIDPVDCGKAILIGIKDGNPLLYDTIRKKEYDKLWDIEYIKPYLRPMSSMTKEEYDQLYIDSRVKEDSVDILDALANDMDAIDWLNAHHFDYRGLIEKGLAIKAPEGMYN